MKISVQQQSLKSALSIVSRAVPAKAVLEIIQNFHLQAANNSLTITGTDLELSMIASIGAVVDTPGSITVPATLFTEIVNSLNDSVVSIELTETPLGIHMECQRAKINISGNDSDNYPPIPDVEAVSRVTFTANRLKKAIESVAFTASTETNRPVLTGVLLEVEGNNFSLVAADGFRLGMYHGKLEQPAENDVSVIIPALAILEIARLLGNKDVGQVVEIGVSEDERFMILDLDLLGRVVLTTQLIQGQFPDVRNLIPREMPTTVTVDTKDLHSAIRISNIMAMRNGGAVTVRAESDEEGGMLVLRANANEYGDNEISVPATITGPEGVTAFSGRYLVEMINVVEQEELTFQMNEELTPGVFTSSKVDQFTHMIMPQSAQA